MEADLADVIAFIMGICLTLLIAVGTDVTRPTSPSASNARYASSVLAKTRQALAETNVPVGKDVSCKLRWRVSRRLRRVRPNAQQHALIQVTRGIMFFQLQLFFRLKFRCSRVAARRKKSKGNRTENAIRKKARFTMM